MPHVNFLDDIVDRNLSTSAGDMGLIPDIVRFHMLGNN